MNEKKITRKDFLKTLARSAGALSLAGIGTMIFTGKTSALQTYWQIDPHKCTQCGRCETSCVQKPSATKCVHAYALCGYCDLCSGYLRSGAALTTAAESQLCPTSALKRSWVEDPYFQYVVDEQACIACGKCVKGCSSFGNGSLFLQIKQDLCLHCNRCQIASSCPSGAVVQVTPENPYILKGKNS